MDPQALAKRYRSLWTGELTASCLFVALFVFYAVRDGDWRNWIVRSYGLATVIVILIQGIIWWRWKLRVLHAGQRLMPGSVLARFRRFKYLNWVLIGLAPAVLFVKWLVTGDVWGQLDTWLGLLILFGAVLEQINYYYYQLMYDNPYDWAYLRRHRRLRLGSIGKALNVDAPQQ